MFTAGRLRLRFVWTTAALVVMLLVLVSPRTMAAQSVVWEDYDVTVTLREDGSFHVVERQVVNFEGGPFSNAFADLRLGRVEDITNVSISEERGSEIVSYTRDRSSDPESFTIRQSTSALEVRWFMPRTFNEQRTFVLEYDVIGGMRVYADEAGQARQQIWWIAIGEEVTEVAPVRDATLTIELPTAVDLANVVIDGPGSREPAEHSADGQTFTWSASDLDSGNSLEGRVEFPAIVEATAPAWQAQDDETRLREQERDSRGALLTLLMAAAGLLTLTAGGVGLLGLWYTQGRDPGVGAVASYLSEPPDDLPPGAAGALVDELVNERDIVATLVDLGRRGVLKIEESSDDSLFGGRGFTIELRDHKEQLNPFESAFVTAIMGGVTPGTSVDLGAAKSRFSRQVETIKSHMYEELVKRGYFPVSPESTRSKYRKGTMSILVGGGVLLGIFGNRLFGISGWIIFPVIAVVIMAIAAYQVAAHMPRKSLAGAESAAKWRAFKRYLDELDQDRATAGASELFQKYLPYALAFGIERSWVHKFAAAGAPAPEWYGGFGGGGGWFDGGMTVPSGRRRNSWGGGWVGFPSTGYGGEGGSRDSGGGFDVPGLPDIQGASDRGSRSLQSASGGLMDLLDLAGAAFEAFGGSGGGRHGGFSGGGRSFGGGGGGGGRSGGGGGGGRGFG